jgi:protein phosphatase
VLTQTAPQAAIVDHEEPQPRSRDASDREEKLPAARRRWPIVTSLLVFLVMLVAGAGYAGWRYSQSQYFIGADNGEAVIYQGINQTVAGISLSHAYQRTGIPLDQLPSTDQQTIQGSIAAASLLAARRIVGTIRGHYLQCHNAYQAQASYRSKLSRYRTALTAYKKAHGTTKPVKSNNKSFTPPKAPKAPAPVPASCPAHPAGAGTGGSS